MASAPHAKVNRASLPFSVPTAESAERAVLGAILQDGDCFRRVTPFVGATDFYSEAHRAIFEAFERLTDNGGGLDLITTGDSLERAGMLDVAGGHGGVDSLASGLQDTANVEHHARIVRDVARRREVQRYGLELLDTADRRDVDAGELASRVASGLQRLAITARGGPESGVLASDVRPETVRWFWQRHMPLGKLTVLDGDPGQGKSTLCLDVAARASTGRAMPDGTPGVAGGTVIMSGEDGAADTIVPRLGLAGADLTKILLLQTVETGDGPRPVILPDDLDQVRVAIHRVEAVFVVVDPLMALLTGAVDAHRDGDIRRALLPLANLAEETGAAIVVVRHLVKGLGSNPLYRGGGSIGIIGAARSGLLVMSDPEMEGTRILTSTKSNLSAPPASLAYRLEAFNDVLRIRWVGESSHTATSLLAAAGDQDSRGATAEAKAFLQDLLHDGPRLAREVKREVEKAGLSWRTVERAKAELGIVARKAGKTGGWSWVLKTANDGGDKNDGGLGGLGGLLGSSSSFKDGLTARAREDRQDRHSASAGELGGLEGQGGELETEV